MNHSDAAIPVRTRPHSVQQVASVAIDTEAGVINADKIAPVTTTPPQPFTLRCVCPSPTPAGLPNFPWAITGCNIDGVQVLCLVDVALPAQAIALVQKHFPSVRVTTVLEGHVVPEGHHTWYGAISAPTPPSALARIGNWLCFWR